MLNPITGGASVDNSFDTTPVSELSDSSRRAIGATRRAFRLAADLPLPRIDGDTAKSRLQERTHNLPAYLEETYWWAYLRPASLKVFDHAVVVSVILWGWYGRLKRAAFAELKPGQKVLQAACVYGDFSSRLASSLGTEGCLDIEDIVPLQVANCQRKLRQVPNVQVRVADAGAPGCGTYDVVCCFFLLHELPDDRKRKLVDALLDRLAPGGKLVFIDYHKPDRLHPLRGLMGVVFDCLEPFAKTLWRIEISRFATSAEDFVWRKETYFGGLYQKVVVARRVGSDNR